MEELQRQKIAHGLFLKDRYQHLLNLGVTGTGKTALLTNMIHQDSFYDYSVIAIEPSGTASPKWQSLLNGRYLSLETPLSLNFMQLPYNPNVISEIGAEAVNQMIKLTVKNDELTAAMRAEWDDAVKDCLLNNKKSLSHVHDCLAKKTYSTSREGIIMRLRHVLSDDRLMAMLCGDKPINIGDLVENRESLVVNCAGMSEDRQIFIGNILTQAIKNYFLYEQPQNPNPLAVYIDECQYYISENMFNILKEGRKWKIGMTLATQDFARIPETLARVMMNISNKVCFRVEDKEAQAMARSMNIQMPDILFLDDYEFVYKFKNKQGKSRSLRPPEIEGYTPEKTTHGWFPL